MGDDCFNSLTTGSHNVGIGGDKTPGTGDAVGKNYTSSESSNITISNAGVTGDNNIIRFGTHGSGNRQQNKCFIAGIRGITTGTADAIAVLIASDHQLGTVSSSIRFKQNVKDMANESSAVLDLRPVTFEYKSHPGIKQYGLIAEEVEKHLPRLVVHGEDGLPETIKYQELPSIMLSEMIKMNKRILALESKLEKLLKKN